MLDETIWFFIFPYILISLCIVFPPTEFISAGLTLDSILSRFLGDEKLNFIEYHIRRTALTVFAHSLLPFGFFAILDGYLPPEISVFNTVLDGPSIGLKLVFVASVILPVTTASFVAYWSTNDWSKHPIVQTLTHYNADWPSVAAIINTEFRRFDKFSVVLGGIQRVIVTDSWVIVVSSYSVRLSHQGDIRLTVTNADSHSISHHGEMGVQFLTILVENTLKPIPPFTLRLKSTDYRDMRMKLQAPIQEARNIMIQESLDEQFVTAFVAHVRENNPRIYMTPLDLELVDLCMGCSVEQSNVRMEKRCVDNPVQEMDEDGQPVPLCRQCFCRPMWCVACLGRWFASRQDQRHPENWLGGRSPCPTCRSTFCILDVSLVEPESANPNANSPAPSAPTAGNDNEESR